MPEVLHLVDGSLDAIAQAVDRLIERPTAVLMRATSDSNAYTAVAQIASNGRIAVALVANDAAVVVSVLSGSVIAWWRASDLLSPQISAYSHTHLGHRVSPRVVRTCRKHTICILYIAVFSDEHPKLVQEQQMANRG